MPLKKAAELARTMAAVARTRRLEIEARALEEFADELDRLASEEITAKTRMVLCTRCGGVLAGELVTAK